MNANPSTLPCAPTTSVWQNALQEGHLKTGEAAAGTLSLTQGTSDFPAITGSAATITGSGGVSIRDAFGNTGSHHLPTRGTDEVTRIRAESADSDVTFSSPSLSREIELSAERADARAERVIPPFSPVETPFPHG